MWVFLIFLIPKCDLFIFFTVCKKEHSKAIFTFSPSFRFSAFLSLSQIRLQTIEKICLVSIKNDFRLVVIYYAWQNFEPFCDRINWNISRFTIYNLTGDPMARFEFLQPFCSKVTVCQIQFHRDFFCLYHQN